MATVNLSNCTPEQHKQYTRMSGAGKGDKPRNCFSTDYKHNYDRIFKKRKSK